MEPILETHKASKFTPEDVINKMPDIVITNILDRLPLQDAVRTGILARDWRYKWTMLSQLVFDRNFVKYLVKRKAERKYGRIISRLLLLLKGTITKFVLYIDISCRLDGEDIRNWILFLSTKGIKDLTIQKKNIGTPLKLPTHLFSCIELKHLELYNCWFDLPYSFHGFPNLLTLEFMLVQSRSTFGKFITMCPLLQTVKMLSFPGKVKVAEMVKLANLKTLSMSLRNLDTIASTSSMIELVGSLPKLEELDIDFVWCMFTEGAAKKRLLTSFPCLKALKLRRLDLGNGILLSCAFELVRCSPNVQTLEIVASERDVELVGLPPSISEEEYNTMGPLQLRSVVFRDLKGSENEVCLIKYLLACSPFLKKIVIYPRFSRASGKNLFPRKLLTLHRASPVAKIVMY